MIVQSQFMTTGLHGCSQTVSATSKLTALIPSVSDGSSIPLEFMLSNSPELRSPEGSDVAEALALDAVALGEGPRSDPMGEGPRERRFASASLDGELFWESLCSDCFPEVSMLGQSRKLKGLTRVSCVLSQMPQVTVHLTFWLTSQGERTTLPPGDVCCCREAHR